MKGGALPLRYFDPSVQEFSSDAGHDVLGVSGLEVRPRIGGKRSEKRSSKRSEKRSSKRSKKRSSKRSKRRHTKHNKCSKHSKCNCKKCNRKSHTKRNRRHKGGFIPSIMEPFIVACSKYVTPVAALSAWKIMKSKR